MSKLVFNRDGGKTDQYGTHLARQRVFTGEVGEGCRERDHEEVFLVLEGSPTLVVDGADHPLREGSFARLDPAPKRTVRNDGDAVARVLIVSAPVSSGYEPMDWA